MRTDIASRKQRVLNIFMFKTRCFFIQIIKTHNDNAGEDIQISILISLNSDKFGTLEAVAHNLLYY